MGRTYHIAVIVKAVNSDFWQTLLTGAKSAMADHPDQVSVATYGPPEESDIEMQVRILEDVIAEGPDAVVIASTSNDLTIPAIRSAEDKGIPVITIDNQINEDCYTAFLATDNRAAAAVAADAMVADWERAGISPLNKRFLVINSSRSSNVDRIRDEGFIDRMRERVQGIEMLDIQYVENDPDLTAQVVREAAERDHGLIGIFADNDMTGIGVANGIREAGAAGRVFAYAFDSNEAEIQAVKDGCLTGMIVQDPFGMGYKGVMYAVDALEGRMVPKSTDTGATIVTKNNLEVPAVQKLLYPDK